MTVSELDFLHKMETLSIIFIFIHKFSWHFRATATYYLFRNKYPNQLGHTLISDFQVRYDSHFYLPNYTYDLANKYTYMYNKRLLIFVVLFLKAKEGNWQI